MKTALALIALGVLAGLFASAADRYSLTWTFLAWLVFVSAVGSLLRVHAVVNGEEEDR
ncbi:hypothetical protein [Curtobacterium sp. P97]|uniref:hypothetical protein n=1 Tax=Curtobacterium sp. P97 TaxID=2939562 RepID=UPI002041DEA6|nr:hypothetical protein [Curtobacterium sp. P97]MCM3521743.1 hypothetical protein [Curtobacterium sp. P97]